uniref:regulator of G-protein signaling 8-like n=1 Tax=Styela clava TaxID=7725 RepID=UPI0019397986|nr:regulator of G-protein signaling 8-like [Styela clava]
MFNSTECDSPFMPNKQVKLAKLQTIEEKKDNIMPLRRSLSVKTFKFLPSTSKVSMMKRQHTTLQKVLNDVDSKFAFRQFLAGEFSEENLDFWCQCERFKKEKSSKQRKRAPKIFNTFIADNAPREINIDSMTKIATKKNIQTPNAQTFDLAQQKIFKLMEKDSFPRFLSSKYLSTPSLTSKKMLSSTSSSLLIDGQSVREMSELPKLIKKLRRQSSI